MLTPLNEQLSGNQPPPSMQPPPVPPGTAPQSPMHPVAPSTLGALPPTPPTATRPSIGNPATPFADPTKNTPSLGIGQQLAAQGRGPDSALVHMAPRELQGLNALAQSSTGQNLPINPKTGLPEAGILSSLLPMLIGAVLTPLTGGIINPLTAGLLVGGGYGLATHSLTKGLMAGLSAYGGAGIGSMLGGMAGLGSSAASAAGAAAPVADTLAPGVAETLGGAGASAAPMGLGAAGAGAAGATGASLGAGAFPAAELAGAMPSVGAAGAGGLGAAGASAANPAMADLLGGAAARDAAYAAAPNATTGLSGLGSSFASALRAPGAAIPGTSMTAPGVPGMIPRGISTAAGTTGIMNAISGAMTPDAPKAGTDPNAYNPASYAGPYKVVPHTKNTPPPEYYDAQGVPKGSKEFNWFSSSQPDLPYSYTTLSGGAPPGYPGYVPLSAAELKARKETLGYAEGGSTAPAAPAKKKKDFFENSLPLGLIGALGGVGGGGGGGGPQMGLAQLLGLAPAQAAGQGGSSLGALGSMGLIGLLANRGQGGNPLAMFAHAPSPDDIDPATGLPRNRMGAVPAGVAPTMGPPSIDLARGGVVSLKPGGFVMDARSVSELGNGSSNAGKELLARHGGQPISSDAGDGVSDNIPAHIMGGPRARVARDEVHFPPEAVARIGRGNRRRGAKKLYGLMARAHAARAQAGRGQDTGLRRGLA